MHTQCGIGNDDERDLICSFGIDTNGRRISLYIPGADNVVQDDVGNDARAGNVQEQQGIPEDSDK